MVLHQIQSNICGFNSGVASIFQTLSKVFKQ